MKKSILTILLVVLVSGGFFFNYFKNHEPEEKNIAILEDKPEYCRKILWFVTSSGQNKNQSNKTRYDCNTLPVDNTR